MLPMLSHRRFCLPRIDRLHRNLTALSGRKPGVDQSESCIDVNRIRGDYMYGSDYMIGYVADSFGWNIGRVP